MGYHLYTNHDHSRFVTVFNTNQWTKQPLKITPSGSRKVSQLGTLSYQRALRRAFQRAKNIVFFNPDMTLFITFTYKQADNTIEQVQTDIKQFIKKTKRYLAQTGEKKIIKYIYVMEFQKRGSIHVHMIANDSFRMNVNKNGYRELTDWTEGFTSVLTINDFDSNFRPYLYLFKYMGKAQRIGKSFIHTSRTFAPIVEIPYYPAIKDVEILPLFFKEDLTYYINDVEHFIVKGYYKKGL